MLKKNLKIDQLTLIEPTLSTIEWNKDRTKVTYRSNWVVKCTCGNRFIKTGQWLRRSLKGKVKGSCKSCALSQRPQTVNKISPEERAYRLTIIQRAKKKDIKVELTFEEFKEIASGKCTYCGVGPVERSWEGKNKHTPIATFSLNGIDRVDSSIGYIKSNCTACCKACNISKSTMSVPEFKEHIRSIYEHLQMGE